MKEKTNNNKYLTFFLIFLTSFLLWIIFSFNIEKKIWKELLINEKTTNIIWILNKQKDLDLKNFWEVYELIKKDFYSEETIDKSKLVEWAIKWMVDSLWDKHTEFLTQKEEERFNEILSWDFEWIWAIVEKSILWVKIERIIKWSPAKKYWLLKGDIITEANWIKLKDLDLYDSVENIKWASWTSVSLKIIRTGEQEIIQKNIIRWKIKIPSITFSKIKESDLWYISINMFWENTDEEFEKALWELKKTKWIIIDLRDNWWWYLEKAVNILSLLIENNKDLVYTKYKKFYENAVYKSINSWNIYKWKIIILINENSASASEITAWALRDYDKAIIVWKKSYWKWSVQIPFEISWWWMLKVTRAKWFTPKDKNIDKEWISPDIEIDFEKQDYEKQYDRQLEKSKEILKEFIKLWSLKLTIDKYK